MRRKRVDDTCRGFTPIAKNRVADFRQRVSSRTIGSTELNPKTKFGITNRNTTRFSATGFTLLELLIVVAILGILAAIVMVALSDARDRGRDAGRKSQLQEYIKALELYYSDNGTYPAVGSYPADLVAIESDLVGSGYLSRIPEDPIYGTAGVRYCASADGNSMVIAVNTEVDFGGSDYCHVFRGPGPDYGCTFEGGGADIEADEPCATRF